MFEGFVYTIGNFDLAYPENGGGESIVYRFSPALVDGVDTVSHTENRAYSRSVTIGVEAGFNRHTDRTRVVALTV